MTDAANSFTPPEADADDTEMVEGASCPIGAHAAPQPAAAPPAPEPVADLDEPAPEAIEPGVRAPAPAHAAPRSDAPATESPAARTAPEALDPAAAAATGEGFPTEPSPEPARSAGDAVPGFLSPHAGEIGPDAPGAPLQDAGPVGNPVPKAAPTSPADTAEIDVEAVEAKLNSPGSTTSFEPVTEVRLIDTDSTYDAGTTTSLMWGARSDVGCIRSHNEDSYLVQSPLFCVCDGMGGHAAGEVASSIAVETVAKTAPNAADPALLGAAVEAANAAVIEAARNGLGKPGMGCTATAAYIENSTVAIAHAGDSRAYLLHEGSLIRVTRDHSYVEELVDAGEITADEARVHPNRSVITRALGSDPNMYADHFQIGIETGDRLILCSDGLSSMIPDGEIERIAVQSSTAQICTDNLVDAALAAGGTDNVTVVVVDLVDDGKLKAAETTRRRRLLVGLIALVATLALGGIVTFASITGSVFLGAHDGVVAIYTGVPGSFMGLTLNRLEDESTVRLDDLPEDTRSRLAEGIPQDGMDAAIETISKYRKQIYEEQTRAAQSASNVRSSAAGAREAPSTDSTATEGGAQ